MLTHPTIGEPNCLKLGLFEEIAAPAARHHERPEGTGYPKGLKGDEIPYLGRILAVIDEIYDALRSQRCYKKAFFLDQSLAILYLLRQDVALGNRHEELMRQASKFAKKINGRVGDSALQSLLFLSGLPIWNCITSHSMPGA